MKVRIPDAMVVLGVVLEVVYERAGRVYSRAFPRVRRGTRFPMQLCGDGTEKVIWLVRDTARRGKADVRNPAMRDTEDTFRKWFDFEPRRDWTQRVRVRGEWEECGEVLRIAYRSDKWHAGRSDEYEHQFKGRPTMHQLGSALYRISGAGLSIKATGIHG